MKELTCITCQQKFNVRYIDLPQQSSRCPKCQLDHEIATAQEDVRTLKAKMQTIYPTLSELNKEKDRLAALYYEAKDSWSGMVRLYEKMDKEAALIQHNLEIKLGKKNIMAKKKAKKKKIVKSPEDIALEALRNLPEEMQALVVAKLQHQ